MCRLLSLFLFNNCLLLLNTLFSILFWFFFWCHDFGHQLKILAFEETIELLTMLILDRIVLDILFSIQGVFELWTGLGLNWTTCTWLRVLHRATSLSSSRDSAFHSVAEWLKSRIECWVRIGSFIESSVFHHAIPLFIIQSRFVTL